MFIMKKKSLVPHLAIKLLLVSYHVTQRLLNPSDQQYKIHQMVQSTLVTGCASLARHQPGQARRKLLLEDKTVGWGVFFIVF